MPAQVRRHRSSILEETRKDAAIRSKDRVFRVEDVERRGAGIRVHHYFDAVAHVVDRAVAEAVVGRIRIVVRDGERIHDPGKPAIVAHHHVGVLIEGEERCNCRDAFAYVAPHQQPALRVDVVAERQLSQIAAVDR